MNFSLYNRSINFVKRADLECTIVRFIFCWQHVGVLWASAALVFKLLIFPLRGILGAAGVTAHPQRSLFIFLCMLLAVRHS